MDSGPFPPPSSSPWLPCFSETEGRDGSTSSSLQLSSTTSRRVTLGTTCFFLAMLFSLCVCR
eukprot:761766-Hanusia_phi.AAC.3